jgi:hypothetical protein
MAFIQVRDKRKESAMDFRNDVDIMTAVSEGHRHHDRHPSKP